LRVFVFVILISNGTAEAFYIFGGHRV